MRYQGKYLYIRTTAWKDDRRKYFTIENSASNLSSLIITFINIISDGNRQSNVVTKTFNVEQASAEDEIAARQRFAGTKVLISKYFE